MDAWLAARVNEVDCGYSSPCWLWKLKIDREGYGRAKIKVLGVRQWAAHRAAYIRRHGPIAEGLQIDHLCRVRACCNPAHLEPVTAAENVRRSLPSILEARRKSRLTHCRRGHELSPENLVVSHKGRQCRTCWKSWQAAHRRGRW